MSKRIPLELGSEIFLSNDEYYIKKVLSEGGTSLIYEAERVYCNNTVNHGLNVSKKVLLKELAPIGLPYERENSGKIIVSKDRMELMKILFKQEIKNIADIQNSNKKSNRIPDMDAYGEYNNTIYIAMNHIKGTLLSDYIYEEEYSTEKMLNIFNQIISIVQSLHELESPFYHLDLKPNNFIIDEMDCIYLFDFGSCALKDSNMIYAYSEGYSAPEVVFNDIGEIGPWSDYYSLGAILYEMATKKKPTMEWMLFDRNFENDVDIRIKEMILGLMQEKYKNREIIVR